MLPLDLLYRSCSVNSDSGDQWYFRLNAMNKENVKGYKADTGLNRNHSLVDL